MSGPSSQRSLVCEEVFDERSQPSEEEVREFAVRIGIDPDAESHLLPLAREGLLKPLPKNWKPVYDSATKRYYYFNFVTRQSSWEHPLDCKFRVIVKKSRSESLSSAGEEDSKTSIKEELKSFEEAAALIGLEPDTTISSKENQMDLSSHGVPALKSALSPLRTNKKSELESFSFRQERSKSAGKSETKSSFTPKPLFSLGVKEQSKSADLSQNKPSKADWDDLSSYLDDDIDQFKETGSHKSGGDLKYLASLDYSLNDQDLDSASSSVIGRFTVDRVRKIDIDSQTKRLDPDDSGSNYRTSDRPSKSGYGQPEFTLSGGGSVFLKSNRKGNENKEDNLPKPKSDDNLEQHPVGAIDVNLKYVESNIKETTRNLKSNIPPLTSSPTLSASSTRSILRTPQGEKRLWDVDPQHMSVSEKALWKQQELEEEKKSVRFNLDKELNISFQLSDSTDSDDGVEVEHVEEEELEWNSKASEDLALMMKQQSKDANSAGQSLKKEKRMSPLEEWAKETWFSKQSALEDNVGEESRISLKSSDYTIGSGLDLPISNQPEVFNKDDNKYGEAGETWFNSIGSTSEAEIGSLGLLETGSMQKNILSAKSDASSSHRLPSGEDVHVLDIDDTAPAADTARIPSPLSQEDPIGVNLATVARKLKEIAESETSISEDSTSRQARAREQALRDWNVKKTDGENRRPPLSRQQSQQQIKQISQQMKETSKTEDRDRAYRDWNVTGALSKSGKPTRFTARAAVTGLPFETQNRVELEIASQKVISGSSYDSMLESRGEILGADKDLTEKKTNITVESQVLTVSKNFEDKLAIAVDNLRLEYETRLKDREQEMIRNFEKDQEVIMKALEEKLQKRIKEEANNYEHKYKEIMAQLERDSEIKVKQLREQLEHKQTCASQKILEHHQQVLAAQEVENQAAMLRVREQHSAEIKALREQFQREEEQVRREHQDKIVNLREDKDGKRSREITDHLRAVEKLRCEKRLVDDKYRILKEKYIKLKGEMKAHLEKKDAKQKENQQSDEKAKPNQINAVEQEISVSQLQQQSDRSSETDSRAKTTSAGSSATSNSLGFHQFQSQSQSRQQDQLSPNPVVDPPPPAPNSGPSGVAAGRNKNNDSSSLNASFLGMNFTNHPPPPDKHFTPGQNGISPTQTFWYHQQQLKMPEKNGNIPESGKENRWSTRESNEFSPLEALRHQLKTLDELEEQFPASSVTDAYLRYPFSDAGFKELESAELEFFRHRIHLERDMIRQAKNTLHAQQTEFRSRLHNFQQRQSSSSTSPSTTLYQMAKEEQELSDMEAKLRRTRTILSEKMIHLRHLENSLNRLTAPVVQPDSHGQRTNGMPESRFNEKGYGRPNRRWDWKNGGGLGLEEASDDISSSSGGSSGFSSTEYTSDGTLASLLSRSGSGRKFKRTPESPAEINVSLHNLNAEISEIWNVLCKQRAAAGLGPPPLLSTQASSWTNPAMQSFTTPVTLPAAESSSKTPSLSKVTLDKNSSLIERTNNLRQWLQKAKISATSPPARDKNDTDF